MNAAREEGSEESTHGETVTADVLALLAIMERVNLGKLVAESKYLETRSPSKTVRAIATLCSI